MASSPPGARTAPQRAERGDLVADVVQRHGRPDHVGGAEVRDAVGQLGEDGADPTVQPEGGCPPGDPLEHARRRVDGDDLRLREDAGELAGADPGSGADVEDSADGRGSGAAVGEDLGRGVGHEGQQHLAFELVVLGHRVPVGLVEVHVGMVSGKPCGHRRTVFAIGIHSCQ